MKKKYLMPKTITDLVTSYSVFIDGKKVGGVLGLDANFNIDRGNLQTQVVLRLAIKRDSLRISSVPGKPGLKRIDFSTTNQAFK